MFLISNLHLVATMSGLQNNELYLIRWVKAEFDLLDGDVHALKSFLQKAGVTKKDLKNRETREFIKHYIQKNDILERVRKVATPQFSSRNQVRQTFFIKNDRNLINLILRMENLLIVKKIIIRRVKSATSM